jgi:hypothetical protein
MVPDFYSSPYALRKTLLEVPERAGAAPEYRLLNNRLPGLRGVILWLR